MPREAAEFTTITVKEPSRGTTRSRTAHLAIMWSIRGVAGLIIFAACMFPAVLFVLLYEFAGRPPYPSESVLSGFLRTLVAGLIMYACFTVMPYALLAIGQAWFPLFSAHSYLQRLATRSTGEVADDATRFPVLVTLEPRAASPTLAEKDPWDDFGVLTIAGESLSFRGGFVTIDAPQAAIQAIRVGYGVESIFSADTRIMLILRTQDGVVGVQMSVIGWQASRGHIQQQVQLVSALEQHLALTVGPLG